jgi:hypothetical protein
LADITQRHLIITQRSSMKRFFTHFTAIGAAVGLLALVALSAPAGATVNPAAQIDTTCFAHGSPSNSIYTCAAMIGARTVVTEISNIRTLTAHEFAVLPVVLGQLVGEAAKITQTQAQMDFIAAGTVQFLTTGLNIHTCHVEVSDGWSSSTGECT